MKNYSEKANNFIVQGSILAIAGILVRFIGLLYRIPLTNIIGDEGIGVYSTAYSIYNILIIISSYTLPLAISKLIASRLAAKKFKNTRRVVIGSFVFAFIAGGICSSICYFGADGFANLMNMPQASFALKTLAPTIFISAFLGVLRGYFQGHNNMVPTALSQIFEQIINAIVSIVAGYFLFTAGMNIDIEEGLVNYNSAAYGAAGGTIGTGAGALAAFVFCLVVYIAKRKHLIQKAELDTTQKLEKYSHILKVISMTIFPIILSTTIFQIISVANQAIFAQYYAGDYSNIWGAYSGKYNMMINLPVSVASSLGAAVIPTLAAATEKGSRSELNVKIGTAIRFNMVVAIPAAVGLAVLARPIFDMLFTTDNELASMMMIVGSAAVVFTALSSIMNSILQGIGNIWLPVKNALIAFAAQIVLLCILLWVFDAGIYAVIFAGIFFYLLMSILNLRNIRDKLDYKQEWLKSFVSPTVSSIAMGVACYFTYILINKIFNSNLIAVIISIVIGMIIYLILLLITRGVDEVDLSRLSKGETIIRIAKNFHFIKRF